METLKLKFPLLYQVLVQKKHLKYFFIMNEEILKFNKKINLISPSTVKIIESAHFLDSVLGAQLILKDSPSKEFYDVGSGNGFPGLILASLDVKRLVKLVESDKRKAEFIEHCAFKMQLNNVEVICTRVENLALSSPAVFVSRAFSSITKALSLYTKACPAGFQAYHFKSQHWHNEISTDTALLSNSKNVPCGTKQKQQKQQKGFFHKEVGKYKLPHNDQNYFIVCSSTERPTK